MKFHDLAERKDAVELKVPIESQNIATTSRLSKEEALDFWDNVFAEQHNASDRNEIDKVIILEDIYDRCEDEFRFDFEIDQDIWILLDQFKIDHWEQLSENERKMLVCELAVMIGKKLGLEDIPTLSFFDGSENDYGTFNRDGNTIEINSNNFSQPKELIDTIAHEVRHAYQYQRALKLETYEDMLYKYNFDNYISPLKTSNGEYLFFTDYQDQLVEAEARAFANLFNKEASL